MIPQFHSMTALEFFSLFRDMRLASVLHEIEKIMLLFLITEKLYLLQNNMILQTYMNL